MAKKLAKMQRSLALSAAAVGLLALVVRAAVAPAPVGSAGPASAVLGPNKQQAAASPQASILPTGAQLFQSPAALAALAAAHAAAQAAAAASPPAATPTASSGPAAGQQQAQQPLAVAAPPAPAPSVAVGNQQQQTPAGLASNLGGISARVDTNELLKQAVQQSQQLSSQQQASFANTYEQGK